MQRTLEFFKWKSSLWSSKASLKSEQSMTSTLREGLSTYAFRQANVFISLHDHFLSLWQGFKVLNNSLNQPVPVSAEFEEAMQGIDGGDVG